MTVYIAIGDIHGRDDLLEKMHARIAIERELKFATEEIVIVYIGDYIDGGSYSKQVVDRVMKGFPNTAQIFLCGNHEALMLACLETDDRQVWLNWLNNGGDETLKSFDISFRFGGLEPDVLSSALGPDRIEWFKKLSPYHIWKNYLFVHAGIIPGIPIDKQELKDLMWVRGKFLYSEVDHGYRVVHGHTPEDYPEIKPNRINIDTGATSRGELTAVVLQENLEPYFLSVVGEPGKG